MTVRLLVLCLWPVWVFRRVLGLFFLFVVSCDSVSFRDFCSWFMEPFFPYGSTLALVYPDLIPSFVGSEGFKVLGVVDGLVISHRFCPRSCFL